MSEIAIISLNDNKIERMAEDGHKKAKMVMKLTAKKELLQIFLIQNQKCQEIIEEEKIIVIKKSIKAAMSCAKHEIVVKAGGK